LLGHIQDVAVCMKSLRVNPDSVARLLQTIQEAMEAVEPHTDASVKPACRKLRIQYAFRLIDLWTAGVNPWWRTETDEERLEDSRIQFELGQRLLQGYPGLKDRDDCRFTCFLNTLGARTAYLQDDFTLAYRRLDDAEAAVWPRGRGSDRTSVAVCRLHRAESLMLHADYQLRTKTGRPAPDEPERTVGIERNVWGDARAKLQSARLELIQAHELLLLGRPNTWWWTWLYCLFAQWHHEWFALHLDTPDETLWPCPGSTGPSFPPFEGPSQRYLASPLHAIRDGLDCVGIDPQRRNEFHILWWQLFLCQMFETLRFPEGFWQDEQSFNDLWSTIGIQQRLEDWLNLSQDAGLRTFAQKEHKMFNGLIDQWPERNWSDIEEVASKRPNSYVHVCRSLRNILLTVEHELLTPMWQLHAKETVAEVAEVTNPQL